MTNQKSLSKNKPSIDVGGDWEKKLKKYFTHTELEQILSYCRDRDEDGWYYGNREQFEKRHQSILQKLQMLKEEKGLSLFFKSYKC